MLPARARWPGAAKRSGPGEARHLAEGGPRVGEDAVALLGGDPEHETVRVAQDAPGDGDELAAEPLAVGPAVGSGVEAAEGLEPRGDVLAA